MTPVLGRHPWALVLVNELYFAQHLSRFLYVLFISRTLRDSNKLSKLMVNAASSDSSNNHLHFDYSTLPAYWSPTMYLHAQIQVLPIPDPVVKYDYTIMIIIWNGA